MTTRLGLRIPARPEYLVLGRLALTGISRLQPIDAEDLGDLKLALTEAASNSMRHAYPDGSGSVEILFELDEDAIAVEVLDDGPGFDRTQVPLEPETVAEHDLDEGGLGLAIIEAVAESVEIGRRPDGTGSRIRFTKRLSPLPPAMDAGGS